MFEVPILEKLKIVFNLIKSSYLFWVIIGISMIFMVLLFIFKKRRKIIFMSFVVILGVFMVLSSHGQFGKFVDYFVEVIMNLIYFPNFCLYSVLFVSLNIIMIYIFNSKKILEHNRKIVMATYFIVTILFCLVISTIGKVGIDLNDKISIYSNKTVLSLIEISTFIIGMLYIYLFAGFILKRLLPNKSLSELEKTIKMKKIESVNLEVNNAYAVKSFNKFIDNVNDNSLKLNDIKTSDFDVMSNALIDLYSKS